MIYCDLSIDNVVKWSGVPCLNCVQINSQPYLDFDGAIFFIDSVGAEDPDYEEFNTRFFLVYFTEDTHEGVTIPLQAISAQTFSVVLGGQNCTISIYYKETPEFSTEVSPEFFILHPDNGALGATARTREQMFYLSENEEVSVWDGVTTSVWSVTEQDIHSRIFSSDAFVYTFRNLDESDGFSLFKRATSAGPGNVWTTVLTAQEIIALVGSGEYVTPMYVIAGADSTLFLSVDVADESGPHYYIIYGKEGAFTAIPTTVDYAVELLWSGPRQTVPGWPQFDETLGVRYFYWQGGQGDPIELDLPTGHVWYSNVHVFLTDNKWYFFGMDNDSSEYFLFTKTVGGAWVDVSSGFDEGTRSFLVFCDWAIPLSSGGVLFGVAPDSAGAIFDGVSVTPVLIQDGDLLTYNDRPVVTLDEAYYAPGEVGQCCELADGSIFFPCFQGA